MPWSIIVTVEHASNAIPEHLGTLGLTEEILKGHVAWDPGAQEAAQKIAAHFDAPLFLGEWSRLVVDLNRSPTNVQDVIPKIAFLVPVPHNAGLSEATRLDRLQRYHTPYWKAVQDKLQSAIVEANVLHLSVHSFTGFFDGKHREMSFDIMFDPDRPVERRLGRDMIKALERRGWPSTENEPYDGRADGIVPACRQMLQSEKYAGIQIEISHNHLNELDKISGALIESVEEILD